jgi:hypothetical protein
MRLTLGVLAFALPAALAALPPRPVGECLDASVASSGFRTQSFIAASPTTASTATFVTVRYGAFRGWLMEWTFSL